MTNLRCEIMSSYWSSRDMTTTTQLPLLLTRDLEARSIGSSGRALLAKFDLYRVDLLGALRPLEFARRLQSCEPRARQALEELLEWTGVERDFELGDC